MKIDINAYEMNEEHFETYERFKKKPEVLKEYAPSTKKKPKKRIERIDYSKYA